MFVIDHRFDTSPVIDENWTIICTPEEDAKIIDYDNAKDNLADHVIPAITLTLSIIGFLVNAGFIYFVIIGIRTKILPFKGYSLLLNRSITDFLVALLTTIFVALRKFDKINGSAPDPALHGHNLNRSYYVLEYVIPHGRTMFTLLLTVDFWAVAGAYGIMALLPFIAVRNPLFYRSRVTNKVVVIVMIITWLVGALYSAIVVALSSNNAFNVFNSADDLIQWTVSSEDYVLSISNLFIVVAAFFTGSFSYMFIIVYLYKKSANKGHASAHLANIVRMAINIGCFATTCIVMAGFVSLPLFLKSHIDDLDNLSSVSVCKTAVKTFELSYIMAIWTTLAMTGWMLRIIIDPITNILFDFRFRELLKDKIKILQKFKPAPIKPAKYRGPNFLARNEFLRKCAEMNVVPISISGNYFRYRSPSEAPPEHPKPKKIIHIRFDDLVI